MNIIYVARSFSNEYYSSNRSYKLNLLNNLHKKVKMSASAIWRNMYLSDIDGFFEGSLYHAGKVSRISNSRVSRQDFNNQDVLVVNFRCVPGKLRGDYPRLIELAKSFSGVKVLFIGADKAQIMPDDSVLDYYDVVFKREPFRDLDRYPISSINKLKIRPTMLSCRYFMHSPYNVLNKQRHQEHLSQHVSAKQSDIFFIGKATDERITAWASLAAKPHLKISGGLLPRKSIDLDPAFITSPIDEKDFISGLQTARINLAIDGHGEFTFRHLEIWCAGGFLLANASLRDVWLPMSMREHEHFECYENTDDLSEKIDYFLEHPEICERIGVNGRKVFQKEYSTKHHGAYIRKNLEV